MRALSALMLVAALVPSAARAHAKDFVVYAPGMGGSPQQAKPYLDTFLRHLEAQLGWPQGSATGEYVDDPQQFSEYVEKNNPGFGLMAPEMFLELSCHKAPVSLLAKVVGTNNVAAAGKYHLVVKAGGPKSLEELKGKHMVSNHLQDPRFVSRVAFDGKIDVEKFFGKVDKTPSPIKPFKQVDRGEADVALVDDAQLAHMKEQPFGQGLTAVYSSEPLPPYPVVAFDKSLKPAERDAVKKAILGLCSQKDGAEVCKSLQIARFEPIDPHSYQHAVQLYCKQP